MKNEIEKTMIDSTDLKAKIRYLYYEAASTYGERQLLKVIYDYIQTHEEEGIIYED